MGEEARQKGRVGRGEEEGEGEQHGEGERKMKGGCKQKRERERERGGEKEREGEMIRATNVQEEQRKGCRGPPGACWAATAPLPPARPPPRRRLSRRSLRR